MADDRVSVGAMTISQAAAGAPRIGLIRSLVALTKPRIIELLLVTAVPTMFLAAAGLPPLGTAVLVVIGGWLAAAGANAFNSYLERDIDAAMSRTQHRPLVRGDVSPRTALVLGWLLSIAAVAIFATLLTPLSALLAALAIVLYVVVYTMLLKRRTPQNIVWGGAAGCMPVLIAWSAITGTLSLTPLVLFMVVFLWTPPHYWPLSMRYREDYVAAGVPMLPTVRSPRSVGRQIIGYAWATVAASLVLVPVAPMGWVYTVTAAVLGGWLLVLAYRCARRAGEDRAAMALFHGSISYLALLFIAVGLDPFLP